MSDNPTIEVGEHFAVVRGFPYRERIVGPLFDPLGFGVTTSTQPSTEPQYDRSWSGTVFKAVAVCGDLIAAEILHKRHSDRDIGTVVSLNTSELQLWPLTQQYVDAICRQKADADERGGVE